LPLLCPGSWSPSLEWKTTGSTDFAWSNTTRDGELVAFASVQSPGDAAAATVVAEAQKADLTALFARHARWWQEYVNVKKTREEIKLECG